MARTSSRQRWETSPAVIRLRARVLSVLRESGPMTDAAIDRHPAFVKERRGYSTLRQRRKELVEQGLVESCGRTRDRNPGGKSAMMTVWRVVAR